MTAKVTLTDGGGAVVSGPIRGNNLGEYVMPTEAAPGAYTVAIDCEAEHATNAVSFTAKLLSRKILYEKPRAHGQFARGGESGRRRASR